MEDRPSDTIALIEVAVEPKTKADHERLVAALKQLADEDLAFQVSTDVESGQIVMKGTSELHLDMKLDLLRRIYRVDVNVGAPQVAYRETIGRPATIDYTHKRQTGGSGQFARVKIAFEPLQPGAGFAFVNSAGNTLPEEFVVGVEQGLRLQKESGLIAGFPLIDFSATLIDGSYHDVDSRVMTFEIAARAALREMAQKGKPKLLEPVMRVEIVTPDEYLGSVIGDLRLRRAKVLGTEPRDNTQIISAMIPLSHLFGYINALRTMTRGYGTFMLVFSHYEHIPPLEPDDDPRFPPAAGMRSAGANNVISLFGRTKPSLS